MHQLIKRLQVREVIVTVVLHLTTPMVTLVKALPLVTISSTLYIQDMGSY